MRRCERGNTMSHAAIQHPVMRKKPFSPNVLIWRRFWRMRKHCWKSCHKHSFLEMKHSSFGNLWQLGFLLFSETIDNWHWPFCCLQYVCVLFGVHSAQYKATMGVQGNTAFHLRLLKGLMLDDLRLQRWDSMISETFKRASAHCNDPAEWFKHQLSMTLQRLLKGLVLDKEQASWGPSMIWLLYIYIYYMYRSSAFVLCVCYSLFLFRGLIFSMTHFGRWQISFHIWQSTLWLMIYNLSSSA